MNTNEVITLLVPVLLILAGGIIEAAITIVREIFRRRKATTGDIH